MNIYTELEVAASVEAAWQVIGGKFGEVGDIITALESSSLIGELNVGAIRKCRTNGVGPFPPAEVEERLVEFDPDNYRYTYVAHSGLPKMFTRAQNTWTIEKINSHSCVIKSHAAVEVTMWFRPFAWLVPLMIKRDLNRVFEELGYYIEHQKVHPRKIQLALETS